ncbi:hypothetical protein V1460_34060 [Streptomyces sp. SCSIO 30461]|uniref:BACON domain-containing protein n=1 Tax=Streptomyces sp. SCSIO 30461 TaxID=3118085 RepID=UPI0030CC0C21
MLEPPETLVQASPARYEAYLDGLFTYCLAALCDHEAATEVLGDVLAISERQHRRCPSGETERKAWLYALARWACLRALAEQRRHRRRRGTGGGAHGKRSGGLRADAEGTRGAHGSRAQGRAHARSARSGCDETAPTESVRTIPPDVAERHRAELARLAWPEAAGTTPEQREALELAVRHRLVPRQVAAVLGMEPVRTRELLASAACEVERTRAALAVVEAGDCPSIARLTEDHQVLLSAGLRRELVRHVDDCPRCRRAAERAGAGGPWPGSSVTLPEGAEGAPAPAGAPDSPRRTFGGPVGQLPLVPAPRAEAYAAMPHVPRERAGSPRFGRDGFPVDPRSHAAQRGRLRTRAVTTAVVAAVVAAPVLALWGAYRGTSTDGDHQGGSPLFAGELDGAADEDGAERPDGFRRDGRGYGDYETAGNAQRGPGGRAVSVGSHPVATSGGVSIEVISPGQPLTGSTAFGRGPGRLTVEAQPSGDTTMITLTASGGAPVSWSLWTDAPWLYASVTSGVLRPGESFTVHVYVDHAAEPEGPWTARVGVDPSGAVLELDGHGETDPAPPAEPPPPSEEPSMPEPPPATEPPPASEPPPATDPPPGETPPPSDPAEPPPGDPAQPSAPSPN